MNVPTTPPPMSPFGYVLLALFAIILVVDFARLRKTGSKVFVLEVIALAIGAMLVLFPRITMTLATLTGVGRGVDFVIYLLLVLLVREALRSRQRQWLDDRRYTELVRAIAVTDAQRAEPRA